jgi:CubicO group peptidase (beta-lactamase class C family)
LTVLLGALTVAGSQRAVARDQAPAVAPNPDAVALQGLRGSSMLDWKGDQQRVGYANMDKLAPGNVIRRAAQPGQLPESPRDFSTFTYSLKGTKHGLDHFMTSLNVVGLLVITDGRIVLERYTQGHTPDTRWTSWSVAKSVTSMLFGAAISDGRVKTLDEKIVKYIPALAGTSYTGVTLRHLLQMSSGVAWNGDMSDPKSDVAQLPRLNKEGGFNAQVAYMGSQPRKAPAGTAFNYNTAEADIAAAVLRAATGRTLSEYLSEKIWQPFGMQADGYWMTMGGTDLERAGCCLSATLRDYGRLGLLALRDGVAPDGTRLLPAGWFAESTRPSPASKGYGYYWWLRPNGRYFASGSFGQHIEVAPDKRTVVAIHSYWPAAFNDELIDHNDTVVDALITFAGSGPAR